ncbi:MAG: hypothetical protein K8F90_18495 [Hyphomicrobiales bacterium]|nr:hypothetical protein [Hyphomicrobiales bacterium]
MAKALRLSMALVAMLIAAPAVAATVTYDYDDVNSTTVPTADSTTGTVFQNVVSSVVNVRRSPYQILLETPYCETCKYTSVSGVSVADPLGSSATYSSTTVGSSTSLIVMWGSPDAEPGRNVITFYLGNVVNFILDGATVIADAPASTGLAFVTAYISGLNFDRVVFSNSGANAFEYVFSARSNTTPEVPLPAGLILLLSGLTGLGFLARARAKSA